MQAVAKAGRLTRSLAAPCLAVNGGVFVFIAAIVAGALVSAYWMSAGARVKFLKCFAASLFCFLTCYDVIADASCHIAQSIVVVEFVHPYKLGRFILVRITCELRLHSAALADKFITTYKRHSSKCCKESGAGTESPTSFTILGANGTPSSEHPEPLPPQQPPAPAPEAAEPATACPAYFRWIHEDLRPWRATGITRETLDGAHRYGPKFRVTVLAGRLYVSRYGRCFQTRDVFTQWGILQLLRRHAGRVPDLDLMFDCQDLPVVHAGDRAPPPPLFRYCGSEPTVDIAFPDWSFWGWPELNIKPWEALRREIDEGNSALDWTDRAPYAYWKGNPTVGTVRWELLRCNVSRDRDWNARIYTQDWREQVRDGFRESDLAKQCTHRYKIYVEGRGWSVSEKYILACDSVALFVRPRFHDFFSRGLMPLRHYWPVRDRGHCRSIKFAVDWGNSHPDKAQEIGENASRFVQEELTMDHVYDYMIHLLNEYARLLRYKPTVPEGAVEVTVESMMHGRRGLERGFMVDTTVNVSASAAPCEMPSAFSPEELETLRRRKADAVRQVETWEEDG